MNTKRVKQSFNERQNPPTQKGGMINVLLCLH